MPVQHQPSKRNRKASPASLKQLEARGRWVVEHWDEVPSLRYKDMLAAVRLHFLIGKTAGEQAIKRAYEIMRETWSDPSWGDRIAARYLEISEKAEKRGDLTNARKALDSLRAHLGIGAPQRHAIEHSGSIDSETTLNLTDEDYESMSDEQLLALAKLDLKRALPKAP